MTRKVFSAADWMLKGVGVPRGVTPTNQVQAQIAGYKPGKPTMGSLLRLQPLMQQPGVVNPVETAERRSASRGIKSVGLAQRARITGGRA